MSAKIRLKGHRSITKAFSRKTDVKNWASKTESEIKDGKRFKVLKGSSYLLSMILLGKFLSLDLQKATLMPIKAFREECMMNS